MPNSILPISILTLLFLMDITVGLLGFEFTQQYIGAAYFFFFYGYYRLLAIQRIILLEVAIFSQMIGYALFFNTTSPPVGIFLTSLTCLSLFLYTLLIHKCISIKKKTLFLLGPLFVIPYWIVLAYHIKENFCDLAGLGIIRKLIITYLMAGTVAYFAQKPSIKSATLLAASLLILINCILIAYHFLGLTYIRYESTFITLVFNYLIINFIVKNMKPDTQKDIII